MSTDALRIPVVTSSSRSGSCSSTSRGNAVRSRISTSVSKPASSAASRSCGDRLVQEADLDPQRLPVGERVGDAVVVVENSDSHDLQYR